MERGISNDSLAYRLRSKLSGASCERFRDTNVSCHRPNLSDVEGCPDKSHGHYFLARDNSPQNSTASSEIYK
jgi:hypothetical protein